jgi:hypothetical protein
MGSGDVVMVLAFGVSVCASRETLLPTRQGNRHADGHAACSREALTTVGASVVTSMLVLSAVYWAVALLLLYLLWRRGRRTLDGR